MTVQARLIELEQDVLQRVIREGSVLGSLDRLDEQQFIEALKQRRFLTFAFTPMCEYLLCSLKEERSVEILSGILLEELGIAPGEIVPKQLKSHRVAFLAELKQLHVEREEALSCVPSPTTRRALTRLARYVFELGQRTELEQLVFLRFSGEVLTGAEFKFLYDRLERAGLLNQNESKFLFPHIDYDVLALKGGTSHAGRYLPQIEELLTTEADWARVKKVIEKAALLRRGFYAQFE